MRILPLKAVSNRGIYCYRRPTNSQDRQELDESFTDRRVNTIVDVVSLRIQLCPTPGSLEQADLTGYLEASPKQQASVSEAPATQLGSPKALFARAVSDSNTTARASLIRNAMAYTDDAVKAKLSALNETQEGIVTVAQWVMFHR